MSRTFDGSDQYLEIDSAPVTAVPFSFACWFNPVNVTSSGTLVSIADKDVADQYHYMQAGGASTNDPIRVTSYDGSGGLAVSYSFVAATWQHAAAVFATTTSRTSYINAGDKDTNTDLVSPANIDRISIGRIGDSTPGTYFNGSIAEVGIWNIALTDADVIILAAGYSPLFVHPENLVAYWPLIRDSDDDKVGGYDLTPANSPTVSPHPPGILYPAPPMFYSVSAGAPPAGGALPMAMNLHRHWRS